MEAGQIASKEDFIEVVNSLLSGQSNNDDRENADMLLNNLYLTTQAWEITKEIISEPNAYEKSVLLTAAKVLRVKVYYYLSELPENFYIPMFRLILVAIKAIDMKSARSLLADSLVVLYMRIFVAEPDLLSILAATFQEDTEENQNRILEILETIPDNMEDEKIVIEDELRAKFVEYAVESLQASVLKTLEIACAQPSLSEKRRYQLFKCFSAWMHSKTREEVKFALHDLAMLKLCFLELNEAEGCNLEASETIITVMKICKKVENYQSLYQTIIKYLFATLPTYQRYLQDDSMTEEVKSFLEVYSVLFNRIFAQAVLEPGSEVIKTILYDVFLKAYQRPGLNLLPLTTNIFTSILRKLNNESQEQLDEGQLQLRRVFAQAHLPLFNTIIERCMVYSCLEMSHLLYYEHHDLNSDPKNSAFEEKDVLRHDSGKLLRKMSNVLGFKLVFKGIAESIHRTIQALQQEAANGAISIATEVRFESELFCVESILQGADHTDQEAFTLVQQLLELVLAINYTKQKLLGTALEIMVGCSKFFGQRVDLLQSAFKFLGNTIQFKTFEDNSAEAIANLCRDNKSFVLENISDFFEFFNKVCYKKDIVVGLTSVVNSLSNRETKTELIMKICQPFAKEILQTTVSEGRTDLTKNFIKNIDFLTLVVQNLSPAEPEEKDHTMLHILTDMWKLLEEILLKHYDDNRLIEYLCKFIKHTMRCLDVLFGKFIEPFFKIVIANYDKKPVSTYLYTVESAVVIFHRYPDYHQWLNNMFNLMVEKTYGHLHELNKNKIDPELLDDFFGLITRYLRYMPQIVMNSPSLELQLKIGIKMIGVKTTCAAKSLYQFWEEIFKLFSPAIQVSGKDTLYQMLTQKRYAHEALKLMVNVVLEQYPERTVREFIQDVFDQVFLHLRDKGAVDWMTEALMDIPQSVLNNGEKTSFISNMKLKSFEDDAAYYAEFFDKFFKRCKAHNMKVY